jgi:type II secretory pathway pseudopilin PulG
MKVGGKTGFTIIEVILVLAVSAMLFVVLIAGQGNNLARRRYDDSVNSFVAFLQTQFDFAMNIQNHRVGSFDDCTITGGTSGQADANRGRSNCAIHGVMLEFGSTDCNNNANVSNRTCREFVRYTWVIGGDIRSVPNDSGWYDNFINETDEVNILRNLNLQRVMPWQDYRLEWGSETATPATIDGTAPTGAGGHTQGAILIVRMPISNTIRVFVRNSDFESATHSIFHPNYSADNNITRRVPGNLNTLMLPGTGSNNADALSEKFICIDSPDARRAGGVRRSLVINPRANNASAVQLLMQDEQNVINGEPRNVVCR